MKFHSRVTLPIIGILSLTGIWLFCTDPQKPDFGDAPNIGNNKQIIADKTPVLNDTLILYLTLQAGTEPLTYQWYKNDTVISRASSDSLKFEPLKLSDTGTYHCVVTNELGSDASNPFKLDSINEAPVIGNNKQLIPVGISYKDSTFSLAVTMQSGTKPYFYRWYKKDSLIVSDTTDTLEFDSLTYADTGKYQCIVSNDFGKDTSKQYTMTLSGFKPLIGNSKQVIPSGTPKKDSSFFMYITATGTKPLSYQWFKDSTPVLTGSGTKDTLKFSALQYADTGEYYCVALNDFGSDTSKPHELSLTNQPPKWSVDTMHLITTEAQLCTLNVKDSCSDPDGDSLTFKLIAGAPAGDTIIGTWYRFTPGYNDAGSYTVTVQASDGKKTSDCDIRLSVQNKNRAPYFLDTLPKSLYSVAEGAKLIVDFKAVDPDGDSVFYTLTKNMLPDNGPVVFTNSRFEWQSTHNDSGMYSIEISATDKADTTKAPVSVAVGNVNRPPQIKIGNCKQGDTLTIKESDTLKFAVTATDPDTGDIPVLLSPKNAPNGSAYDTANGTFVYIPAFSVSTGLVNTLFLNVRFYATDNNAQYSTDSFYIHIQVLDSNSAPKWTVNSTDLAATEGMTLSYNMSAVFSGDNEGDKVLFTKTFGAFNTDTSQWSWTLTFTSFHGKDTVCIITATDNHNPPASASLTLTISIADSVVPVVLSKPSNIIYKSMKITWTQSTEPQFGAYKLYYDVSSNVTEMSNLAATITDIYKTVDTLDGLNENTRYYVRVFTYNANNTKSGSNVVDSTTLVLNPPTLTISTPVFINDSAIVNEAVVSEITGTASSMAGILNISARINGVTSAVTGTTSWNLALSTTPKKKYNTISISVSDSAGKVTSRTVCLFIKPTLTPSTIQVTNTTTSSVTVAWTKIDSCDRYILFRSEDGTTFSSVKDTVGLGYADNLVEMGKEYFYKVKGYYSKENVTDTTGFSNTVNGIVKAKFEKMYYMSWAQNPSVAKVLQTTDNGYIIAGFGSSGGFLLKISAAGEKIWSKEQIGNGQLVSVNDLIFSQDNSSFLLLASDTTSTLLIYKTDLNGNIQTGWPQKFEINGSSLGGCLIASNDGGYAIFGSSQADNNSRILKLTSSYNTEWQKNYNLPDWRSSCTRAVQVNGGYVVNCFLPNGWFGALKIATNGDSLYAESIVHLFSNGGVTYSTVNNDCYFIANGYTGADNELSLIKYKSTTTGLNKEYERFLGIDAYDRDIITTKDGGHLILASIGDTATYLYKLDAIASSTPQWTKTIQNKAFVKMVIQAKDNGYLILGTKDNLGQLNVYILKVDESGNSL